MTTVSRLLGSPVSSAAERRFFGAVPLTAPPNKDQQAVLADFRTLASLLSRALNDPTNTRRRTSYHPDLRDNQSPRLSIGQIPLGVSDPGSIRQTDAPLRPGSTACLSKTCLHPVSRGSHHPPPPSEEGAARRDHAFRSATSKISHYSHQAI